METISITTLSKTGIKTIHETFIQAFADYVEPITLSCDQLKYMLERRGCDLNLSFGAFSNDRLVGFILNGIGDWNSQPTAYDTGTGIIAEFRKQGIASKIFNESLPILHKNGISQYLLEVIRNNVSAIDLYRKAGFNVTREFDYYISTKKDIRFRKNTLNAIYKVREIQEPAWDKFREFWDIDPSWQNSVASISRKIQHFTILGIFNNDELHGYGVIENHTGDIPQLAISQSHRRIGLASTLLKKLLTYAETDRLKIINIAADYEPFKQFAGSVNLKPGHGQYEMLMELKNRL